MRKVKDPLLGAPRSQTPEAERGEDTTKATVIIVGVVSLVLIVGAGFYLVSRSPPAAVKASSSAEQIAGQGGRLVPVAGNPFENQSPPRSDVPETSQRTTEDMVAQNDIALATLTEADGNDLDTGCLGAFSVGRRTVLYVSGNTLIIRPDGRRVLTAITDGQFQAFANDDAVAHAGGYRIRLAARGQSEPGFDGHSVNAALTLSQGDRATSFSGNWGFGC